MGRELRRSARRPTATNTVRKITIAISVSCDGDRWEMISDSRMSLASCGGRRGRAGRLGLLDVRAEPLDVGDEGDDLLVLHARRAALGRELVGDLLGLRPRQPGRVVERRLAVRVT